MQSKKIDFEIIKGYNIFVEKEKVRYRDTQRPKETFFLWTLRESRGNWDNWQKMTKRREKMLPFCLLLCTSTLENFMTLEFYLPQLKKMSLLPSIENEEKLETGQ